MLPHPPRGFLSLKLVTTYLYLLRVPVLLALVLGLIGPMTLLPGAPLQSLLEGFFDVHDPGDPVASFLSVAIVAAFVFLFVIAATTVSDLVIRYGPARFDIEKLPFPYKGLPFDIKVSAAVRALFFFYLAAGLSMVVFLFWYLTNFRIQAFGAILAALAAVAAATAVVAAHWSRTPSTSTRMLAFFFRWSPEGFLTEDEQLLRPGHGFAFLMMSVVLVLFVLFALTRFHPPTAGSAVFLLLLLCWLLAGLAFIVDRFRIPLIAALASIWIFAARFPESDHYFKAEHQKESATRLDAATVLTAQPPRPAIVVAAAGGGIQAAAWTAEVLSGLVKASDAFAPAVRIISGVSGGAVGTMYFAAAYENGTIDAKKLDDLVRNPAQRSSLEAVGWGLAYPDFARSVFPLRWYQEIDRAQAMEESWAAGVPGVEAPLRQWKRDAAAGVRPAVIFNATVVETGKRFMIGTVDPPAMGSVGRETFASLYPRHDLKAVTAARLSSTFPYVTPVARINQWVEKSKRVHIADGGYYDNFGITSLTELLHEAMTSNTRAARLPAEIMLIEISGSDPANRTTCDDYFAKRQTPAAEQGAGGSRGWFYQLFAPLEGLYNVREAGQRSRNDNELRLLREALEAQGVIVKPARFLFPCIGTPLSWHLTAAQKTRISDAWRQYDSCEKQKVLRFLNPAPAAGGKVDPCQIGR
jgi:predicted acylesterase/phospholipase RssA